MDIHLQRRIEALKAALPGLEQPAGMALGVPAFVYSDPAWFEAERREVFAKSWFAIGFESDVPQPGDATPIEIAGWSFLMTRARDGQVRVFHNLCPHRGMRVLEAARKDCRGLTCAWHSWTFDLDGRLVGTPNIGGAGVATQEGLDRAAHGLMELRSGTWMGVVFVNVDGKARSLAEDVRPIRERFAAFDLEATVQASDMAYEYDYGCNWKLAIEGGIEDYHIPFVHRQAGPSQKYYCELGGDSYVGIACTRSVEVGKRRLVDPSKIAGPPLPLFPHVPAEGELEASIILLHFPNLFVAAVLDHITFTVIMPIAADRTRYRRRFRLVEPGASDPAYAAARKNLMDGWITITNQDGPVWTEVQTLMRQREELGFRNRFSGYWEPAIHYFQKMAARRMLGAIDRPGATAAAAE